MLEKGEKRSVESYDLQLENHSKKNSQTASALSDLMRCNQESAQQIDHNVGGINKNVQEINGQAQKGVEAVSKVIHNAEAMKTSTEIASRKTTQMYKTLKEEPQTIMERSKEIDRINELTSGIVEITEQTELLALNASMECGQQIINMTDKEEIKAVLLTNEASQENVNNIKTGIFKTLESEGSNLKVELTSELLDEGKQYSTTNKIKEILLNEDDRPNILICMECSLAKDC